MVFGIRGLEDLGKIRISFLGAPRYIVSGLAGDLRLVTKIPRSSRWMSMLGDDNSAERLVPDILVYNEEGFYRQVDNWSKGQLISINDRDFVYTEIKKNKAKYFVLNVKLPSDITPGIYELLVRLESVTFSMIKKEITIKLEVLPFALDPADKYILAMSNDFGTPRSKYFEAALIDQSEHGMNATRMRRLVNKDDPEKYYQILKKNGFHTVMHDDAPVNKDAAVHKRYGIKQIFYGIDEPQPKRRFNNSWNRMLKHLELSRRIHQMGGLVGTSLPYLFGVQLRVPGSSVYVKLPSHKLKQKNLFEPLDWANYPLAVQKLGIKRRRPLNQDLWQYIKGLQQEYETGQIEPNGKPSSKHSWSETYYLPLGFLRYPFYARLLYGFYLFNSHLDGVCAWTYYRPKGNPFDDSDGIDATLAYPTLEGAIASTYCWEAVSKGVNDLRYALTAQKLIKELKKIKSASKSELAYKLEKEFLRILAPFKSLEIRDDTDTKRIDKVFSNKDLQRAREKLIGIILKASQSLGTALK